MKLNLVQTVSLRIIVIFTVAIFVSFIPDYLHDFFGDWYCKGSGVIDQHYHYSLCNYGNGFHTATWHWGYRHWLFVIMGIFLAIVQFGSLIVLSIKNIHYEFSNIISNWTSSKL